MDYISCNDKQFWADSDARTIQNAIDFAKSEHIHEVVIPHRNERTGEEIWYIDQNIMLPSSMTVILADAYLYITATAKKI